MTKLVSNFSKLFLLSLLMLIVFVPINGQTFVNAIDDVTLNVNDFSEFTINDNNSAVNSIKTETTISFEYTGSSSDSGLHDNYIMLLDDYGHCFDFEYKTRFNYSLTDINDRITFRMMMGSYYTFNGSFIGLPDSPGNEDFLFSAGLTDISSTDIGYHVMYLYPNDVKLKLEDNLGSIGYSGDLEIYASRVDTTLTCILRDTVTHEIYLEQVLIEGVTKPINYLYLDFYTGGTDSTVEVCAYYIDAALEIPDFITIVFGFSTPIIFTSLLLILIIPVYFKKK